MEIQFNNNWILWYHSEKNNWKLSGYKQLYKISSISDLWKFYNNWNAIGGILNKHIFLMREGVTPLWEDQHNINGGCWSFKILEDNAEELWTDLSVTLLANKLYTNNDDEILGNSIVFFSLLTINSIFTFIS